MLKFFSMLALLFLASCLAPQEAQVSHAPLNLRFPETLEREGNLDIKPKVFVMFYWPQKLDFSSNLYEDNLDFEVKLTRVMSEITKLSDQVDDWDREVYNFKYDPQFVNLGIIDRECAANPDYRPNCPELRADYNKLLTQYNNLVEKNMNLKGGNLEIIKSVLDGPNIADPVNFWPVDESATQIVYSGRRQGIHFNKFGKLGREYSTKKDDIVSWKITTNELGRTLMSFIVRERDETGRFNGITHEFNLERRSFLDYARFFGPVKMKVDGVAQRLGVAKLDFVYLP